VVPIGLDMQSLPTIVPVTDKIIIHVGGFTFEKNHVRLLHIFKRIKASQSDVRLWLVGDGPLRFQVEQQVQELGLSDSVRFLGYRSDVLQLIQQAKVLVLPSIIEGLPGVLLEAMYCKTPVVAYDVGGISEVVKNQETGWLVKSDNEAGFVQAIQTVLHADTTDVVNRAHSIVVRDFDNRAIAKKFEAVYRLLIR
jgi:L-malate glycosyltransferase